MFVDHLSPSSVMSNKQQRVQPQITFDEFNRLRILDAEHAKHTESLAEDSKLFIDSQSHTASTVADSTGGAVCDTCAHRCRAAAT